MTWPVQRVCGAALAVALLLGGCGGGDDGNPRQYELEATRTCLEAANVDVSARNLDFVASTALGGAVRARFDLNSVTLAFGESPDDAARIETAYRNFAGPRIPIEDVLVRDRNVVMLWETKPAAEELARVQDCLSGG